LLATYFIRGRFKSENDTPSKTHSNKKAIGEIINRKKVQKSSHHPEEDLAKFGYYPNMKYTFLVKASKITSFFIFWIFYFSPFSFAKFRL
jgi:hypothetical protein